MRLPIVLAFILLAGCAAPAAQVSPASSIPALRLPELPPVFGASVLVGEAGNGGLGGEPSVAVGPDGTIFVAAPVLPAQTLPKAFVGDGGQIRVWRSTDGGATFKLLNDANGRLTPQDRGNGDADVAVGPDGSVYAIDLGGGVPMLISRDHGDTWTSKGKLNAKGTSTDRQWIDVEGDLLAVSWANQSAKKGRGIDVTFSTDRGETWTKPRPLVDGMIQFGPVEIAPGGKDLYIPYVQADGWKLHLLASHDGGANWTDVDTGHVHPRPTLMGLPDVEMRWSPTYIFPVAAADKAGHVYLAFSEYRKGEETTHLLLMRSDDGGATFGEPVEVSKAANAVLPWIVAGEAGHVAVSYFASDLAADPDKGPHSWRLEVALSRDADGAATFQVVHTVKDVHVGSTCSKGGSCAGGIVHAAAYEDRSLLDFFEMAMGPDGRLVVVWTQTEGDGGRYPRVMFAGQSDGDGLLARI